MATISINESKLNDLFYRMFEARAEEQALLKLRLVALMNIEIIKADRLTNKIKAERLIQNEANKEIEKILDSDKTLKEIFKGYLNFRIELTLKGLKPQAKYFERKGK